MSGNLPKMSSANFSPISGVLVFANDENIINAISVLFNMAKTKYMQVHTIFAMNNTPNHISPVSEATPSSPGSTSQKLVARIRLMILVLFDILSSSRSVLSDITS